MEKEQIKIRDWRSKERYFIDDIYLNEYAKLCGVYATAIYNSLSRHSNIHTQKCFPSVKSMAEQHSIDDKTVRKAIGILEEWHIITVLRKKDEKTKRQACNNYTLLDKSEWLPSPKSRVEINHYPGGTQGKSRANDIHHKDNKDLMMTKNNELDEPEVRKDTDKLLNIFLREINPNIKITNKLACTDAMWLIKKYGLQELESLLAHVKKHKDDQYFPTIATPTQLRDKMIQLKNHINKNGGEGACARKALERYKKFK